MDEFGAESGVLSVGGTQLPLKPAAAITLKILTTLKLQ
jgi:hypothetical protein